MLNKNHLIHNTFLYAVGPLLNRLIAIVLIPFYSFLLLPDELGYYDIIVTASTLITTLATLKISDGVYRWLIDSGDNDELRQSALTNSMLVLLAGIGLIIIGFIVIPGNFIAGHRIHLCLYVVSTLLYTHLQQVLRGLGFVKQYTRLSLINVILLLVSNIVFLGLLKFGLEGVLLSAIAANTISIAAMAVWIKISKYIKLDRIDKSEIKKMIAYSTPLVFNAVNWWLMGGFDRIIIVYFIGLDLNGIYAIANKFASILVLINSFFIPAWQDFILANDKTTDKILHFNKYFNKYLILLLSLMLVLSAGAKFGIEHFIDAKYNTAWKYIPLLLAGSCFLALTSFLGTFFLLNKNTGELFKTTLIGSAVNITVSLLLIKSIGLYGPCAGMFAGFFVSFLLRYNSLKRTRHLSLEIYPILILLGCFSGILLMMYSNISNAESISIAIVLIVLLSMNKGVLSGLLFFIKKGIKKKE